MHTVCNDRTLCTTSIKTLKDEAGMAGPKIYACGVYTNPMIKLCRVGLAYFGQLRKDSVISQTNEQH